MTRQRNQNIVIIVGLYLPLAIMCKEADTQNVEMLGPLDTALTSAATYEYGQNREALSEIDSMVQTALNSKDGQRSVEKNLLAFLETNATLASKQFICRKLGLIGTEASIPLLSKMLGSEQTFDMALFALTRHAAPGANTALRKAISKTNGKMRVGVVAALGQRRDSASVKSLAPLIYEDPDIARAALSALGSVGTIEAAGVLEEAITKLGDEKADLAMNAYLKCADRMVVDGNVQAAKSLYKKFIVPDSIRIAALTGMVLAEPDKAEGLILNTLRGSNDEAKTAAIRLVRRLPKTDVVKKIAAELPKLKPPHKIQLLSALSDRGDNSILPDVEGVFGSDDTEVRLAAIKALGALGDRSSVDRLVGLAAAAGAEQETARTSLHEMTGEGVDEKILSMINDAEPALKIELIKAAGERLMASATRVVLAHTSDSDEKVRLESIKTLGMIGTPEQLPGLLDTVNSTKSDTERLAAEKSVVSVVSRVQKQDHRAEKVLAALPAAKSTEAKVSMMNILGNTGDSNALSELRKGLQANNRDVQKASIRALSSWSTGEVIETLAELAETSPEKSLRILGLRGFIQQIELNDKHTDDEKAQLLNKAFGLSTEVTEKRKVLAGWSRLKSVAALDMVGGALADPSLKHEIKSAIEHIVRKTRKTQGEAVLASLTKLNEKTNDADLKEWTEKLMSDIKNRPKNL